MEYSLNEVLGCAKASTFPERYAPLLTQKPDANVLLAELILCMDDLENAKPAWFDKFSTSTLAEFLVLSHRHYLESVLPSIERQLEVLTNQADCPALISEFGMYFFKEYRNGMIEHFTYEEESLFPSILEMETSGKAKFDTESFKSGHPCPSVDMKSLMILLKAKHEEKDKSMSHRILLEKLTSLDRELRLHEFIEEHILMARIR